MAVMKQFVVRYTTRQGALKDIVGDTYEEVVSSIKKLKCCKSDEDRLIARKKIIFVKLGEVRLRFL